METNVTPAAVVELAFIALMTIVATVDPELLDLLVAVGLVDLSTPESTLDSVFVLDALGF